MATKRKKTAAGAKPRASKTAAQLHEAARVARRSGAKPEAVRALLDRAAAAERAESAS